MAKQNEHGGWDLNDEDVKEVMAVSFGKEKELCGNAGSLPRGIRGLAICYLVKDHKGDHASSSGHQWVEGCIAYMIPKGPEMDRIEQVASQLFNNLSPMGEKWERVEKWRKDRFRNAASETLKSDSLHKIAEFLKREGGVLQLSYYGSDKEYIASCMFGKEAPDSDMYAGHSIQFGDTVSEAVDKVAQELNL